MAAALPLYNVLVLGPYGVGKTSIASWLTDYREREKGSDKKLFDREHYDVRVSLPKGDRVLVRLHDTLEMEKDKGSVLPTNFFRRKDGFVLVWDIKRGDTLRELKQWYQTALSYLREDYTAAFIIFANKAEREMNRDSEEYTSCLEWSRQINSACLKTSSLEGNNLEEGLVMLTEAMTTQTAVVRHPNKTQSSVKLKTQPAVTEEKCCKT